jgi:hypothetical protein
LPNAEKTAATVLVEEVEKRKYRSAGSSATSSSSQVAQVGEAVHEDQKAFTGTSIQSSQKTTEMVKGGWLQRRGDLTWNFSQLSRR